MVHGLGVLKGEVGKGQGEEHCRETGTSLDYKSGRHFADQLYCMARQRLMLTCQVGVQQPAFEVGMTN